MCKKGGRVYMCMLDISTKIFTAINAVHEILKMEAIQGLLNNNSLKHAGFL